ncbi:MAG: hypothetical protein ACRDTE_05435 [Pseudonocardiaceae bacterium]
MSAPVRLSVRSVRAVLSCARVDISGLTITADDQVWTDVESGRQHTSVVISGAKQARRLVRDVLFERGLRCALYSDRDEWSW